MGKKDKKNIVSDGDNTASSNTVRAGRRIITGRRNVVIGGSQINVGGRVVTDGSARQCTSCGGRSGWSMTSQNGKTVTVHTGCGAVQ